MGAPRFRFVDCMPKPTLSWDCYFVAKLNGGRERAGFQNVCRVSKKPGLGAATLAQRSGPLAALLEAPGLVTRTHVEVYNCVQPVSGAAAPTSEFHRYHMHPMHRQTDMQIKYPCI